MATENKVDGRDDDECRVAHIVQRARREIGVRDLLSFTLARIWSVLLAVGAALFVGFDRKRSQGKAAAGPQQDTPQIGDDK